MKSLIPMLLVLMCIGCTSFGRPVPAHHKDHYYVGYRTTFLFWTWQKLHEFKRVEDGRWLYVGTRLPLPPEDNPTIQRRQAALRKRKKERSKPEEETNGGWR